MRQPIEERNQGIVLDWIHRVEANHMSFCAPANRSCDMASGRSERAIRHFELFERFHLSAETFCGMLDGYHVFVGDVSLARRAELCACLKEPTLHLHQTRSHICGRSVRQAAGNVD